MSIRVALSFLGTGQYQPTTYTWNGDDCNTRFMPVALESLFEPGRLLVAETPGARQKHGEALREACDMTSVTVPRATDETAWWRMFNALTDAVPEGATLLVDVTHGFRSQPFLSLAVVIYLRVVKDVEVERIVYGAYEAGEEGTSPVVDLTSFLDLIDWAKATEQFKRYGDAAPVRDMFTALSDESQLGGQAALRLRPAGEKLSRLTRALSLNRPLETLDEADGLIGMLEGAMDDAMSAPPAVPAKRLLVTLAERFAPLGHAEGSVFTSRGFGAQAAMLRFYMQTRQYLQAFTLGQEMLVSWTCVHHDLDPLDRGQTDPDLRGRRGGRALLKECDQMDRETRNEDLASREKDVARFWTGLRRLRNDVAHAGFSHNPTPSQNLIEEGEGLLSDVADFFDPHAELQRGN
ncbi:TIGR02221 family CRISPR-associated protein [Salinibacter sp.]|uniref:TIGR02221 family CRISPR-associated protein n=1 Tax=Salinibacter sp. TaxID=2065818 RepID=UPI0021E9923F|nr:TIGR02221 family CRISPR-associated protein [Salinibacter sp.]